jgi:ABC-type uncharacterized transport system permease subunit
MFELPGGELVVFLLVLLTYLAATLVAVCQLRESAHNCRRFLNPLVSLAVTLEAVLLVFRAAAIKAIPLTGLFESMIVLTVVFGLLYLFLSLVIRQVWFSSLMVWAIFATVVLAGVIAAPASEPMPTAATPWAIAHAAAMIGAAAAIMLATAAAVLHLLADYKLKHKKVMQVLGRMPNIEKLDRMTLGGLQVAFLLISAGIISGIGLICSMPGRMSWSLLGRWFMDPKVACIAGAWLLLAAIILLSRVAVLRSRTRAYMTVAVFILVLSAIVVVTALGLTQHQFSLFDGVRPVLAVFTR